MKKILATYSICNGLTFKIYDIIYGIDDYILCGYDEKSIKECKVEYNDYVDDYYFFYNGTTFYLNDFIRTDVI